MPEGTYQKSGFQLLNDESFDIFGYNFFTELLESRSQEFQAPFPCQFIVGFHLAELLLMRKKKQ